MSDQVLLLHYGGFQPLWCQPGLIQVGLLLADGATSVHLSAFTIPHLQASLHRAGFPAGGVLVYYTDPFYLRQRPLRLLSQ